MSTPKELVFQLTGLSRFREGTELRTRLCKHGRQDPRSSGEATRRRAGRAELTTNSEPIRNSERVEGGRARSSCVTSRGGIPS